MKRNLLILAAASGFALSANAAIPVSSYESTAVELANEYAVQGGYWGLNLGYNYLGTMHYDPEYAVGGDFDNLIAFPSEMVVKSKWGWDVALTTGYRYYGWRFEAELGFRTNPGDNISGMPSTDDAAILTIAPFSIPISNLSDVANLLAEGNTNVYSLLGNVIYDRYFQSGWMLSFGLGAGGARINYGISRNPTDFTSLADYSNSSYNFKKGVTTFAFQAIVGVGYSWNDYVETALTYRFFYALPTHYDVVNDFILGDPTKDSQFNVQFNPKYLSQTINLEFRFT